MSNRFGIVLSYSILGNIANSFNAGEFVGCFMTYLLAIWALTFNSTQKFLFWLNIKIDDFSSGIVFVLRRRLVAKSLIVRKRHQKTSK